MELKQASGLLVGVEGNTCFVCLRRHVTLLDDERKIIFTLPYSWIQLQASAGEAHPEKEIEGIKTWASTGAVLPELPRIRAEDVGAKRVVYIVDDAYAMHCKAQGIVYPPGTMYIAGPKAESEHGLPGYLGLVRVY